MISILAFVLLVSYVNAACDSTGGVRCYKGSDCCSGYKCYEKNAYWAACKQTCDPNWVDPYDNIKWTCNVLSPCDTSGSVRCYSNADCCGGYTCYEKNAYWAACKPTGSCDPNWVDPYDNIKWTCNVLSGSTGAPAVTTRYWDCCKPSCGWASNVQNLKAGYTPVRSCNKDGSLATVNSKNICVGGGDSTVSYTCTDQLPFESNGVLYAFAAANLPCCACYKISFANGKSITVQVTNSGSDLGTAHFDIMMPGGGFGIYNGCAENSGTPKPANGPAQFTNAYTSWGAQYGGVGSLAECNNLPAALQPGCQWRFTSSWANMDNPQGTYTRVKCPAALVAKSNCLLNDDPVA